MDAPHSPDPERVGPGGPGGAAEQKDDDRTVPARALGISLLALTVAALLGFVWPDAIDTYSGLVWLLALVPVFLLSYHRGWQGASVAALLSMVALTAGEVLLVVLLGQHIEWQLFGFATVILVAVTLGTGLLSEVLHQRRMMAEKMAYRDPLTGLANRRMIQRDAERAMAQAERVDAAPALIFFDLIRFKRINDELGFVAGDRALRFIGQRIRNTLREGDAVARVGGDEFAALLPLCSGEDEARSATERVKAALWQPLKLAGETVHVGARVGYALFPEDGEQFDELLSAATPRKSQEHGWSLLDGPDDDGERRSLALESDLVDAVETGRGLQVHYQPIARLADDAVVGAEALLRWDHPERGMLDARHFVPIAERLGLIRQLERITLERAAARARRWRDREVPIWISINLSLTSLEADEARRRLARVVEEHSLSPGSLVAEVTERIAARDPGVVRVRLRELRESGLGLAVDDFGTGHSSLAYLERFPLDMLKIDQEFVARLARGRRQQRLVEGIIGLTMGLDLTSVAEGVETESQRAWLHSAGCDLYQGYLLARPCPAPDLTRMLEEGRLSVADPEKPGIDVSTP